MRRELITAPSGTVLDVERCKLWLGLGPGVSGAHEVLQRELIPAAEALYYGETDRLLLEQVWDLWLDACEVGSEIRLPLVPLQAVEAVTAYDSDGTATTVEAEYWEFRKGECPELYLLEQTWSDLRTRAGLCVRCRCGYGAAEDVPAEIALACRTLLAWLMPNRGKGYIESAAGGIHQVELPDFVQRMLARQRVEWIV